MSGVKYGVFSGWTNHVSLSGYPMESGFGSCQENHTCMAVLSSIKFGAKRVMVGVCFSGVRFGTICLFSSTTQLHSTRPHSTPHGSCCISIDSLMAGVML
ncbi:hypothetical protein ILYODFUR_006818 [Ilyodon furcidens]|uniref:Uncharacterized protein n=1 Tax=Ilyodon furcidens TaxID=33524 RepID=A0ABV0TSK2_9TELE